MRFKPGIDDLREVTFLTNIPLLLEEWAIVRGYDLVWMERLKENYPAHAKYCKSIGMALEGAELCFIFTEWPQMVKYFLKRFKKVSKTIIIDGRNCYGLEEAELAGVNCESIGRRKIWPLIRD